MKTKGFKNSKNRFQDLIEGSIKNYKYFKIGTKGSFQNEEPPTMVWTSVSFIGEFLPNFEEYFLMISSSR
jgi:hypothetical protein